jgi:hypothetical protein
MRQFLLTCHTVLCAYCALIEYLRHTFRNVLVVDGSEEVKCAMVWASGHATYGAVYINLVGGLPGCSVREERNASAAARHLLGVARPIHHSVRLSGITIPLCARFLAIARLLSVAVSVFLSLTLFRAFALGPTLPWRPHLVPRLKSIIKTWNSSERF